MIGGSHRRAPDREDRHSRRAPASAPYPPDPVEVIDLPPPRTRGGIALAEALARRRSVRELSTQPLEFGELSQLLWAAQGTTADWGARTAPSAGALYPLELYVATPGILARYVTSGHRLVALRPHDLRLELARDAFGQSALAEAAAVFAIVAVSSRSAEKYGERADRYVKLEAGHVAQNILLQAVALGLAAVPIGAFDDGAVRSTLELPDGEEPLYLVAVGRPLEHGR